MAIYISAGHHLKDPGAVSKWGIERDLAIELRDRVVYYLQKLGAPRIIKDKDNETLGEYLRRIKPGNASVVAEIHWNAAMSLKATGTESLISDKHNDISSDLASRISAFIAKTLKIPNRGVKTERDSARGKLAFVRQEGACVIIEVCFISNENDMKAYHLNREAIAKGIAQILLEFENRV